MSLCLDNRRGGLNIVKKIYLCICDRLFFLNSPSVSGVSMNPFLFRFILDTLPQSGGEHACMIRVCESRVTSGGIRVFLHFRIIVMQLDQVWKTEIPVS